MTLAAALTIALVCAALVCAAAAILIDAQASRLTWQADHETTIDRLTRS